MVTKSKSVGDVRPTLNEDGKYVCLTDGAVLPATPEEGVRQGFIAILMNEYGYPANRIRREVPIYHGRNELKNDDGSPVRADLVVYANSTRVRSPLWSSARSRTRALVMPSS